jgi:hypothetical protein
MDLLWLVWSTTPIETGCSSPVKVKQSGRLLNVVSPTSHILPYHFCFLACLIFIFPHPTEFTLSVVDCGHISQSCLLSDHRNQFFRWSTFYLILLFLKWAIDLTNIFFLGRVMVVDVLQSMDLSLTMRISLPNTLDLVFYQWYVFHVLIWCYFGLYKNKENVDVTL